MFFKKHKYVSGKIRIISDFELSEEEIGKIIDIVNENMVHRFYEPCYYISRAIYHELKEKKSKLSVETSYTIMRKINIKISVS